MGVGAIVNRQAFLPPGPIFSCKDKPLGDQLVWLQNKYGHSIPALYIRSPLSKRTILFSHGNAEDITHISHWMNELSKQLKCDIMAYEYSGYADTHSYNHFGPDVPSEEYCYANGHAAYEHLVNIEKVDSKNIVVFGRSLGSGPAVELAYRRPVGGLILQSPLLSAVRVVMDTWFTMPFDIFANIDKIPYIKCPTLIVHGELDTVVPVSHGKKLYEMLKCQKYHYWFANAGHNDIEAKSSYEFVEQLTKFIDNID